MDMTTINPYIYHIVRVVDYKHTSKDLSFAPRVTMYHELEWIDFGEGVMEIDGQTIPVKAGDLIYKRPGVSVHAKGIYNCYLIIFNPWMIAKPIETYEDRLKYIGDEQSKPMLDIHKTLSYPLKVHVFDKGRFNQLFYELLKLYSETDQMNSLAIKYKFLEIMYMAGSSLSITGEVHSQANKIRHVSSINSIMHTIQRAPSKPVVLEALAKEVGVSKYHFSRIFKEIAGMNLSTYHQMIRLNYAKHLLISTKMSIETVGISAGFETGTYFYKIFKKRIHMTPNQYREQFRAY